MPLSLYSAWLPMRIYGGNGSGASILSPHLSTTYQLPQNHHARLSQHLNFGLNRLHSNNLAHCDIQQNNVTDSEDDGSVSPLQDLSKSQQGK